MFKLDLDMVFGNFYRNFECKELWLFRKSYMYNIFRYYYICMYLNFLIYFISIYIVF